MQHARLLRRTGRLPRLTWALLLGVGLPLSLPLAAPGAEPSRGERIYRQRCASCHGANGEGTKVDYPHPLIGDRSLKKLTEYIAESMPDDDPGTCVGEEAEQVAAFVFENFYSKVAQERNKPPRIELARLTVRQYQNAVADLVGSFRPAVRWDGERGLRGEYFSSKRMRTKGVFSRVDPEVRFDYGKSSPEPETIKPGEFAVRWEGSVLAPESGEYEFILRTPNSGKLWVNDLNRPLIDVFVKSGNETEYRAAIRLQEGRVYPIRLEFFKANQGVRKKDEKAEALPAAVALAWKLPQRADEVIPAHNLSPNVFPESFVLSTPFPPDDRSLGYERGTSISKAWDQATTDAAIEVADYVSTHLRELSGTSDGTSDRAERLQAFCRTLAERAFRRPLSAELAERYVARQFRAAGDPETAVKRVVLLVLKSPRFLYREVGAGKPDGYDVASRLSFGLWDSLPDAPLLEAAAAGRLTQRVEVVRQAERMCADLRLRSKLRAFALQWLKVEQVPDIAKDRKRFPEFDESVASDLRTSLDLFLEDVFSGEGEGADFRQLFLADYLYLNGRLAPLYGATLAADAPFQKVVLMDEDRAGVLSHPYLMANFAYTATSSPIHRGVFLARSVLGRALRPPPEAFTPLPAELHPNLTTRQRIMLQTRPEACRTCHGMINPLGFPLEHFDAVGRYREQENGRPIDATGSYQTRDGGPVSFHGVRDLGGFLAQSAETHDAFVEQLFHYLVKQPIRAYGPRTLADLRESFAAGRFNIQKLAVEIMAASALTSREPKS
jgi:hypothetical protein